MRSRPRGGATAVRGGERLALAVLGVLLLVRVLDPSPMDAARLRLFDLYQRLGLAAAPTELSVVVVDIDDASLARYGQWPWPRNLIARLIDGIVRSDARAVGMEVLFAEPDRNAALSLLDSLPWLDAETRRAIESLPDGDRSLATSMRGIPVVLGAAIDARVAPADAAGTDSAPAPVPPSPTPPLIEQGSDPRPHVPRFAGLVRNLDVLAAASAGTGVVSLPLEPDGVVRRIPAVIAVGDALLPTLPLEIVRVAGGGGPLTLRTGALGLEQVALDLDGAASTILALPTDSRGRMWLGYGRSTRARYVSAASLLEPDAVDARLSGRLVLVGATAAGLMDLYPTPLGIPMPGVEIHAQLIENLLSGRLLVRPDLAAAVELLLAAALGATIIILQRRIASGWLLALWVGTCLAVLAGSWLAFAGHRLLIDGVYPVLAATVVYAVVVVASFVAARRRAEAQLRERESRLRSLQAELLDLSRRSAVAELSSALAHELNQPLSAIGNYVQACRRMLIGAEGKASDKIYEYMERAVAQVDRAAAIIAGLRDIVERGHTVRAPEQLNPTIEEAVATALLSPAAARIAVLQRYGAGLPRVQINRIQIQQVVLNLARNAVEAMAASPRRVLTIETLATDEGTVEVRIGDTGSGLAPDVEARLFRPVASAKEAGMGIGLSISRSIVEAHGGRIWATRNDDGGMTFHFSLPTAGAA